MSAAIDPRKGKLYPCRNRIARNGRFDWNVDHFTNGGRRTQVPEDLDLRMMARCIEISRASIAAVELPFGCVIRHDDEVAFSPGTEKRKSLSTECFCLWTQLQHPHDMPRQ